MTRDIRADARLLGGEASGTRILCPGPGHSKNDRSLSLRRSVKSPIGYFVHSFAEDDILACLDHVRHRLGLPEFSPGAYKPPPDPAPVPEADDAGADNIDYARRIWHEAKPITGTIAEYYLYLRGLRLDSDIDFSGVLRFHPKLRLDGKNVPGMVALMRDILTNEPRAIQRTFLTKGGHKICRKMLCPTKGCAIKIDRVQGSTSLAIGEGLESTLSGRVFGYSPAWAVGPAGAIGSFPVLDGVEHLLIFAENDHSGANEAACTECGERWLAAGRTVEIISPPARCKDLNDELRSLPAMSLGERSENFLSICDKFWPGASIVPASDGGVVAKIKEIGVAAFLVEGS